MHLLVTIVCRLSSDVCDYLQLISSNNVATYGTLCALATFDRQEIQRHVLNSRSALVIFASQLLWLLF